MAQDVTPAGRMQFVFILYIFHLVYLLLESLFISRKAQVGWRFGHEFIEDSSYPAQKRCQMLQCYSLWLFVESFGIDLMAHDWFFTMFLPLIWFLTFWVKMNDMTIYLDGFTISHCHISHGIFETRSFPVWHRVIWPLVGIRNALCITCSVHHKTQEVWQVCNDFYYCMYSLGVSPTH